MNTIKSIVISEFWGDKKVELDLKPDVNFLIGPNGSGKTTSIRIITSALRMDTESIIKLPFKQISIFFENHSYITVTKGNRNNYIDSREGVRITYEIKDDPFGAPSTYWINGFESSRLSKSGSSFEMFAFQPAPIEARNRINSLIRLSWISVNRTSILSDSTKFDNSSSDKVLDKLSKDFTGYFSQIQYESDKATKDFQKFIFSSFLNVPGEKDIEDLESSSTLRKRLVEIFKTLDIQQPEKSINTYFNKIKKAEQSSDNDFTSISLAVSYLQLQAIIKQWGIVSNQQDDIFKKKKLFLEIINSMLRHKSLYVNESNELRVRGDNDESFDIAHLSSGERQLLIILGEALLQNEEESFAFIADEPEISLHVEWQEKLVSSIRRISPNSQIIFATHSPDIVGSYHDNAISIEQIVYGD